MVRITRLGTDPVNRPFPDLPAAIAFAQEQDSDWQSWTRVTIYEARRGDALARHHPEFYAEELASIVINQKWAQSEYQLLQRPQNPATSNKLKPIIGYRCWTVNAHCAFTGGIVERDRQQVPGWCVNRISVRSLYAYVIWPGPQVEFQCDDHARPVGGKTPHQCGVHAYHSVDRAFAHQSVLASTQDAHQTVVTGLVAGYGSVLVHDLGWRAEEVHVLGVLDQGKQPEIRRFLASEFDVPLLRRRQLEVLAGRRGRAISKGDAKDLLQD